MTHPNERIADSLAAIAQWQQDQHGCSTQTGQLLMSAARRLRWAMRMEELLRWFADGCDGCGSDAELIRKFDDKCRDFLKQYDNMGKHEA